MDLIRFLPVSYMVVWKHGDEGVYRHTSLGMRRFVSCVWRKPMETPATTIKAEARRIVDQLPDSASWKDLIYRIYVRQSIEAGIKDADEGRVESVEDVRRSFGLPE